MRDTAFCAVALVVGVGPGACAQTKPEEESAAKVTFSGPDYITIKHEVVFSGPPPFEVMLLAERYCAASGKSAAVTPHGAYRNSTSFICVAKGEKAK